MTIVGEPGTNKSSCLEFAIEPLRKIDRDNLKTYKKKLEQYETTKNDPDKAIEQPVYGQIVLSDITVEDFLKQHLNTPRGLAIYADELMGFVKSFSRYRSGNDEEVWTLLFTGVPIIVNRLHSDSFSVSSPFVGSSAAYNQECSANSQTARPKADSSTDGSSPPRTNAHSHASKTTKSTTRSYHAGTPSSTPSGKSATTERQPSYASAPKHMTSTNNGTTQVEKQWNTPAHPTSASPPKWNVTAPDSPSSSRSSDTPADNPTSHPYQPNL